jgi:hypothetical protein
MVDHQYVDNSLVVFLLASIVSDISDSDLKIGLNLSLVIDILPVFKIPDFEEVPVDFITGVVIICVHAKH